MYDDDEIFMGIISVFVADSCKNIPSSKFTLLCSQEDYCRNLKIICIDLAVERAIDGFGGWRNRCNFCLGRVND